MTAFIRHVFQFKMHDSMNSDDQKLIGDFGPFNNSGLLFNQWERDRNWRKTQRLKRVGLLEQRTQLNRNLKEKKRNSITNRRSSCLSDRRHIFYQDQPH